MRKFYDILVDFGGGNPNYQEVVIYNKWFKTKKDLTPANVLNALVEAIEYGKLNSEQTAQECDARMLNQGTKS